MLPHGTSGMSYPIGSLTFGHILMPAESLAIDTEIEITMPNNILYEM
jgi:hypothetical protein